LSEHRLTAPISKSDAVKLKIGDIVYLDGEIITSAGFPTHQRISDYLDSGTTLPIDLHRACFFHMGSLSDENGKPIYVNPTTSSRFNQFMPRFITHFGLSGLAGKGGMDAACAKAIANTGSVYFSMIGGAAPLLTEGIVEIIETGWDDLIMQFRLTRFRVKNFGPLTVAIDAKGHSIYDDLTTSAQDRLPHILKELDKARAKS
jgi:fumarate hydratase subunit beta